MSESPNTYSASSFTLPERIRSPVPSRTAPPTLPPPHRPSYILIGIDFGTTYSGVAWAKCKDPRYPLHKNDINVILDWPGGRNHAKVPTRICYDSKGGTKCGYEIESDEKPLEWFKLLLLNDHEFPKHIQESKDNTKIKEARDRLKQEKKEPVTVIADYLRYLWTHAEASIRKAGADAVVNSATFVVVLTFPAIWPPHACDKMEEAAKQAGILEPRRRAGPTKLHLVSEPEAAALAIYEDVDGSDMFEIGDSFVVLDAGGGTCDVITYTLISTDPLQVEECVKGDGNLCGAIFLDQAFETKLKEWIPRSKRKAVDEHQMKEIMRSNWEEGLKKDFSGDDRPHGWPFDIPPQWRKRTPFNIPLINGSGAVKFIGGRMWIPSKEMKDVWASITGKIYQLLESQIKEATIKTGKRPSMILMAGGLGGNDYLYEFLNVCNIRLLRLPDPQPWSSICRGGVHRARQELKHSLPVMPNEDDLNEPYGVISRIARQSYGITKFVDFVDSVHEPGDKYFHQSVGRWVAINQMTWYLKQDDSLADKEPVKYAWRRYLPHREPKESIDVEILCCTSSTPPKRRTQQVKSLCRIATNLPPFHELPLHENDKGEKFRMVEFEVLMTPTGNALQWSVWINGKNQGEKIVNYARSSTQVTTSRLALTAG